MLEETGCDGIMVGRGCQGNPWLFRDILAYLKTGAVPPAPSLGERCRFILRHLDMLISLKGEYVAIREMRRHAAWYTKGVRGAARWRQMLNQALCRDDFERLLQENAGSGVAYCKRGLTMSDSMILFPLMSGVLPRPGGGRAKGVFLPDQGGNWLARLAGTRNNLLLCPWLNDEERLYPVGVSARVLDVEAQPAFDEDGQAMTVFWRPWRGQEIHALAFFSRQPRIGFWLKAWRLCRYGRCAKSIRLFPGQVGSLQADILNFVVRGSASHHLWTGCGKWT